MRRANRERLEAIWRTIEQEPGARAGRVARKLGAPRSSVTRALPALEEAGLLLREDGKGRLWTWRKGR
jgi:Mn-dependent DtxR family transcriptional regulator